MDMMRRREFLLGTLGAGAVATFALRSAASSSLAPAAIHPGDHGAIGNGFADDLQALNRTVAQAVKLGAPIDGGDLVFAVRGPLHVRAAHHPRIRSLRLRQLEPANGLSTLHLEHCTGIEIDRLEIDVGGAGRVGDMNSTFGLWIEGGAGHVVKNVEVSGDGKNSLIAIWATSDSSYDKLVVRDSKFDDPMASDDVMQGIWLYGNSDCVVRNPVVLNLTGNASYVGRRFANLRTRGIALNRNTRVTIVEPLVRNVDQGIDLTGSDGNRACVIEGGRTSDCGSVGVKFANSAIGCRVSRHVAERCGMYGFMASGPAEARLPLKTTGCEFVDCTAIDTGYNHISFPTPSGFIIRRGDYDLDYPKRIRFIRCRAIDRQKVKTMKFGFYSDVARPTAAADANVLIDCLSEGHARAARAGAWA